LRERPAEVLRFDSASASDCVLVAFDASETGAIAVQARPYNGRHPRRALAPATVKLLALDTSTESCSAALWLDGELAVDAIHAGQRHTELVLPMIDDLLRAAGIGLTALDAIAFGEGPGSFTGLRIACAVAQGLAFGAGLPVVGIGTLLALAQASAASEAVCCLDARMRQVYYAAYRRRPEGWTVLHAPGVYAPDAVPLLPEGSWVGCGNGFSVYGDALRTRLGGCLEALARVELPHAREIAILAAAELARGGGKPAAAALPIYVRDKVALTIEEQP
jgi:tRNA threonylcarbamoyladenosine biosynthesis protein TsaB